MTIRFTPWPLAACLVACLAAPALAADPAEPTSGSLQESTPQASKAVATEDPPANIRITRTRSKPLDAPVQRGWAALTAGDFSLARQSYDQALKIDPRQADALYGLAHLSAASGNQPLARHYLQRAQDANPRDTHAAAALLALGATPDRVQAESQLKSLIQYAPDTALAYFALGTLYAETQRWADAVEALWRAALLEPDHPDYHYQLAVSLDRQRQRTRAQHHYQLAAQHAATRKPRFDLALVQQRLQALAAEPAPPK